jgi:hypothetical protein
VLRDWYSYKYLEETIQVLKMNYEKIYKNLCAKGVGRRKGQGLYLEKHHIVPTFFFKNSRRNLRYNDGIYDGDGNNSENLVLLTAREHFLAHILLCKIWKNTKWYHRCASSLILFFNRHDSTHIRNKHFSSRDSKLYERYKLESVKSISAMRKGTMPVKDLLSGKMIGSVSVKHPNVLAGIWVHHSHGRPSSNTAKSNLSKAMKGLGNSNSKYTDDELIESYTFCCKNKGFILNQSAWIVLARREGIPYLTSFRKFRFDGTGMKYLISLVTELGYKHLDENAVLPFHSKLYKKFMENLNADNNSGN